MDNIFYIIFAGLFGWFLKSAQSRRANKRSENSLIVLVTLEIGKNVHLLSEARVSSELWPQFLYSEVYKNNSRELQTLPTEAYDKILEHYKDVQEFEDLIEQAKSGKRPHNSLLQDRAEKALFSGMRALFPRDYTD